MEKVRAWERGGWDAQGWAQLLAKLDHAVYETERARIAEKSARDAVKIALAMLTENARIEARQ